MDETTEDWIQWVICFMFNNFDSSYQCSKCSLTLLSVRNIKFQKEFILKAWIWNFQLSLLILGFSQICEKSFLFDQKKVWNTWERALKIFETWIFLLKWSTLCCFFQFKFLIFAIIILYELPSCKDWYHKELEFCDTHLRIRQIYLNEDIAAKQRMSFR